MGRSDSRSGSLVRIAKYYLFLCFITDQNSISLLKLYLSSIFLLLHLTEEYPNKAPVVKFVSKMFHPNIYAGEIQILVKTVQVNLRFSRFIFTTFLFNSIPSFFQMVAFASIFCKTSGVPLTTFRPY